jgi:hypothetical protein
MSLRFDWPGYDALQANLSHLTEFDAYPLMERWADIIVEGNRRGLLAGTDGYDNPMPALKYRDGKVKATRNRRVPMYGTSLYETTGIGNFGTGPNDNLPASKYRDLTGPRLAPRRDASRAIKNLHTEIRHDPTNKTWEVIGAWYQVVSEDGVPFLPFHFRGEGRLPTYDLRPIRAKDRQFALNALRAFVLQQFRQGF